jgi:hypothetical protein
LDILPRRENYSNQFVPLIVNGDNYLNPSAEGEASIVPVGTSWRITNSSPCNANFIYTTGFATLPNLDPDAFGIFTLSAFYSILLVKATSNFGGTIYYNVDI